MVHKNSTSVKYYKNLNAVRIKDNIIFGTQLG